METLPRKRRRRWRLALLVVAVTVVMCVLFFTWRVVHVRSHAASLPTPVRDLGAAENLVVECIGCPAVFARRAFGNPAGWQKLPRDFWEDLFADVGVFPRGWPLSAAWMYMPNSSNKVVIFVEGGVVVGVMLN